MELLVELGKQWRQFQQSNKLIPVPHEPVSGGPTLIGKKSIPYCLIIKEVQNVPVPKVTPDRPLRQFTSR